MSRIKSIEIVDFQFDSPNKERIGVGQLITYKKGRLSAPQKMPLPSLQKMVIVVNTSPTGLPAQLHAARWTCWRHS